MHYFAYGSNMSLARLRHRVPSARDRGRYCLGGYQLRFHKCGRDGSAKCDAFFTGISRDIVYGRLFEMSAAERISLDRAEGLGNGYELKELDVVAASSQSCRAFLYLATHINAGLKPFDWYKHHVLVGAIEADLPGDYIQRIRAVADITDPDVNRSRREMGLHQR
jgi:gamma-glutamylcyclotransferase